MNRREVKRAPVLRFKGFTNDWEQRKFENLVSRLSKTSNNESLPNVTYDDIKSRENSLNKDITELIHGKKGIHFNKDDILFGKLRPYLGNILLARFNGIAVGDFWVLSPKDNNISSFLFDLIQTSKYKYISNLSSGSKMPRSDWNLVSKASFWVPIQQEQNKIGKIFQLIDNLVSLQQRKLRLLKLLKKATQQNIFASTECLPKLKYRNLTGKWQLYRLKDVAKITMGQSPNSKNYTQNPIDHILVQGNADIRNGYVFPRIWTTEITKVANKGDIILCVRAPAGDVGRTKFNVVIGRGVAAIKGNDFIFQQLQFMKSSGYWKKYISGSTFESINSNDIKNAKIFCPSQLEQKNISSLLDDIDTSIQIQQKNILDFKYIKQFLLQNMFI